MLASSNALDDFFDALVTSKIIHHRSNKIIKKLKRNHDVIEQELKDVFKQLYIEIDNERYDNVNKLSDRETSLHNRRKILDKALNAWEEQTLARTVIVSCTAFEVFLQQFLIEQAVQRPQRLYEYIRPKLNQSIDLKSLEDADKAAAWITKKCGSFQKFRKKEVREAYNCITLKDPFKFMLYPSSIFVDQNALIDAMIDIQLLLVLRHQFVHNKGMSTKRYERNLENIIDQEVETGKGKDFNVYRKRIHKVLQDNYSPEEHPPPIEILQPKTIPTNSLFTKNIGCNFEFT